MNAMLFGAEVFWWLTLFAVHGTGLMVLWRCTGALPLPVPLALIVSAPVAVISMIVVAALVSRLLPPLKEGAFGERDGRMKLAWGLRYLLVRVLFFGPLLPFIQYSSLLRWMAYRALGAKVELGFMSSSDISLPDISLVEARAGSMVGSRSRLSTHTITGGKLVLGKIRLGRGTVVGADCNLSPGVSIGDKSVLSYGVLVANNVRIGSDVFIGKLVRIGSDCVIGDGAVIETESKIPNGTVIPEGGRWVNPRDERSVGFLETASAEQSDRTRA